MTTKVTVTNHGPSPVQVKIMDRWPCVNTCEVRIPDTRPRFTLLESKYRAPPMTAGQTAEFHVHAEQELAIVELLPNGIDEA